MKWIRELKARTEVMNFLEENGWTYLLSWIRQRFPKCDTKNIHQNLLKIDKEDNQNEDLCCLKCTQYNAIKTKCKNAIKTAELSVAIGIAIYKTCQQ